MYVALGDKKKAAELLEALLKAERARPPADGTRYEGLVADAETLLTELSVELDDPKLRADIPSASGGAAAGDGKTGALTQDIVDALRKQLENQQGGKGLNKDIVDALEQQVQTGDSSATTIKIPAPKSGSDQAQPGPAPAPGQAAPAEPK
jgi:hypothetical protein